MPEAGIPGRRDPLIGRIIAGRYGIYGRLGTGGTGAVYLARQAAMDRLVAIKLLSDEVAANPIAVRFFVNEARAASRLRHPNTITLHDFGRTDEGRLYLAMEYLEGISLARLLRTLHWLPWRKACSVGADVAASLAEAHAAGIVHRDIKPGNIFLCRVGERDDFVKVLDFGLAMLRPDLLDPAEPAPDNVRVGTPHYASPEQIQRRQVDGRSDLYSLGVVLYEMLCGRVPFDASERLQLLVQQVDRPPPPLPPLDIPDAPPVPPAVANVVWRLLRKQPDDRHESAEALRRDLARLAATPEAGQPPR